MLFPKFTEATEAVLFIALNSGAGPVSSRQICSHQNVLPRHLEPALQILVKAGILKGTKGACGGYTIAREKRKISLGEIFMLLAQMSSAETPGTENGNTISKNITTKINDSLTKTIELTLGQITIEDLCKQFKSLSAHSNDRQDFNI